ncbi:ATP-grasp domain-containing protein [Ligilactobacillus salivarius]|uniref:ATP-grasp domain-containing protein n=1 Tax=Ligilactobacillus salivarius TaxID=1624 RepID=UPI002966F703|nr:ATP-grasp domain-containing protein [Ligilactobacillus salivarius]MDW3022355.1 ATP-grasp domain-containing protein [Ligilactobacillus salivarius]
MKLNYVFLFLSDPLDSRIPDVEYEKEYKSASKYFSVGLINQERLFEDNVVTTTYKISNDDIIVYRGWMLKPQLYDRLVTYVEKNGGQMFTNLSEYEYTHLIPNWVKDNSNHVKTKWTIDLSDKSIIKLLEEFNGAVTIKDFVKSRKYEWDEAFYIPDVSDTKNALRVIHNFINRQGSELIGGLVLRDFIELKNIGRHPKSHTPIFEEYRVFYIGNKPLVVINYWNDRKINLSTEDKKVIMNAPKEVKAKFYTIDFARKSNGKLIIMEMGDGQVSGLQGFDEQKFYDLLWENLSESRA